MNNFPWLTLITVVPTIGAIAIVGFGPEQKRLARCFSLGFSLVGLVLTVFLLSRFDSRSPDLQFVERYPWIPSLGVDYFLGVDGLGLMSILLAGIVIPIAILASQQIEENARAVIDALAKAKPNSVKGTFINSCTISATMSPPVRVDLKEFATSA